MCRVAPSFHGACTERDVRFPPVGGTYARDAEDMTTYLAHPIDPAPLKELRSADDAGRRTVPVTDEEGGAPLRCCLRRSAPGERIALVSYAPLRRWAAGNGVDPGAYDEQGPVFIHARSARGRDGSGLPFVNAHRMVRRYSAEGHILGGQLVDGRGRDRPGPSDNAFDDPAVALVHVRAVEYGCFLYEVRRG